MEHLKLSLHNENFHLHLNNLLVLYSTDTVLQNYFSAQIYFLGVVGLTELRKAIEDANSGLKAQV